jgi:alpha-beta hydrolase superfamily lysophospholipase
VPHRGTAILLHGFTACPQQFDELGPKLAAAGYEVFVPLFPGHGAIPTSMEPRIDNTSQIPKSTLGWVSFTSRVNELASLMEGKKVIIGLTQGANLALHASQKSPTLYDKVVAIAPMLSVQFEQFTNLFSNSISILNIDEFIMAQRNSWPKCEADTLPPANRGGFCNFENRSAIVVIEFGKMVADLAKKQAQSGVKTKAPVQLVISHMNDGVSNNASEELVKNMNLAGSVAKLCVMPKEVPHSMISIHDTPYVKPWNAALFQSIEDFVTKGTFIPGSAETITNCDIKY